MGAEPLFGCLMELDVITWNQCFITTKVHSTMERLSTHESLLVEYEYVLRMSWEC